MVRFDKDPGVIGRPRKNDSGAGSRDGQLRRQLEFIRAHIDAATHDARIAVQIGASGRERIQAGIDAVCISLVDSFDHWLNR